MLIGPNKTNPPYSVEHLWSPWRNRHVARSSDNGDSVFTDIAERRTDEEDLVLYRGRTAFVLLNLYPYNNGHLLVVPYRKVTQWSDLTADEQQEMTHLMGESMQWLTRALSPDGFNVGMNVGPGSGAGIPGHIHMHVVPRWTADTNFMPVTAGTKVLPESLQDTWRKLRAAVGQPG